MDSSAKSSRSPSPTIAPGSLPLPPRRNLHGLPPTYLTHLRALLHQWLHQKATEGNQSLWTEERLREIEVALWEGAILTPPAKDSRRERGMLEQDWTHWIEGSARRKTAWKQQLERQKAEDHSRADLKDELRKVSTEPERGPPPISPAPDSATSTPIRERDESLEDDEGIQEWCQSVSELKGFRKFKMPKRDDWEDVNYESLPKTTICKIPGSFPQSGIHDSDPADYHQSTDNFARSSSNFSSLGLPTPSSQPEPPASEANLSKLLLPVFCVHFPHPGESGHKMDGSGSFTTIRLRREHSLSGQSMSSMNSSRGRWWGSSSGKWSSLLGDREVDEAPVSVDFVEGHFALPTSRQLVSSKGSVKRRLDNVHTRGRRSSVLSDLTLESVPSSYGSPKSTPMTHCSSASTVDSMKHCPSDVSFRREESGTDEDTNEDTDEERSTSSSTHNEASKALNLVVSGLTLDMPRKEMEEGLVGVVGGTVIVQGLRKDIEKRAVGHVMSLLVYTISIMILELSLFDTFSIPREPDLPIPTPVAPISSSSSNHTSRRSADLSRYAPLRDNEKAGRREKEGKGGFFGRLGKDTKGVFEGILGKRGSLSLRRKGPSASSSHKNQPSLPSFTSYTSSHLPTPPPVASPISPSSQPDMAFDDATTTPYHSKVHNVGEKSTLTSELAPNPISSYLKTLANLESLVHSTTPNLSFPLPPILLRVRKEENLRREKAAQEMKDASLSSPAQFGRFASSQDPLRGRAMSFRLGGDVRSGLNSLAPNLDGLEGWIKLQKVSALYCVGLTPTSGTRAPTSVPAEPLPECDQLEEGGVICQSPTPHPLRLTYSISSYLSSLVDEIGEENLICPRVGCELEGKEHMRWFVHGSVKVGIKILETPSSPTQDGNEEGESEFQGWASCSICSSASDPRPLTLAKHYPFAKMLDLIIYSSLLSPPVCSHSATVHAYAYRFRTSKGWVVELKPENVGLLGVRLPRLQVGPNVTKRKSDVGLGLGSVASTSTDVGTAGEAKGAVSQRGKKQLKDEIETFFAALDSKLASLREPLEREYSALEESSDTSAASKRLKEKLDLFPGICSSFPSSKASLLSGLAGDVPLNHTRHQFFTFITSAMAQLAKCQKICLDPLPSDVKNDDGKGKGYGSLDMIRSAIPEYASQKDRRVHALPGSDVLIREDEPASVVAYTLSSLTYFAELTASKSAKNEGGGTQDPSTANTAPTSTDAVEPSAGEAVSLGTSPTSANTRPPMCEWQTKIEHRDSPRDILSLRSLVKKKSDSSMALDQSSKFATPAALSTAPFSNPSPVTEVSLAQVEGVSEQSGRMDEIVKRINRATGQETIFNTSANASQMGINVGRRGSVTESETSSISWARSSPRGPHRENGVPPSSFRLHLGRSVSSGSVPGLSSVTSTPVDAWSTTTTSTLNPSTFAPNTPTRTSGNHDTSWGSVTSSFANSVNSLWKLGSEVGETISSMRIRGGDRSLQSLMGGPLSMDNSLSTLSPRPHLHFTHTLPEKLRVSCTVYFATAFDSLRRRCAVDKCLVGSLERTDVWDAQGGKSKAGFWMTRDKKFIVKELVSKWTVSDMHALLAISPAYFHYMTGTYNKPTSLAKIVGFYTVTMRDLQSGQKRRYDLLVMENLFQNQTISKTFDLKGIEGRKVAKRTDDDGKEVKSTGTLFDADWLEGMQKDLVLFHPYAKRILLDAIYLDTKFLSSQSIMDYSLLLGLDTSQGSKEQQKDLVVGLVDAIGSFNLFKTIESRGKIALNRGGDVTIIPPDQYRERFENALRHYFIACPDKWSKSSKRKRRDNHEVLSIL